LDVSDEQRRAELKRFLRARRAALQAETLGLRVSSRRRTPGLRREEVASIADVGVTWYTWLEQGRDIRVSREALERIAHALRLSPSDAEYLFALAAVDRLNAAGDLPEIDPRVELVIDNIDRCPAFVATPRFDVIAFNTLADRVYDFDGYEGRFRRNHIWRGYMDPRRRHLYALWEQAMSLGVGMLRANYASRVGDPSFEELLRTLRESSPEFIRVWETHHTAPLEPVPIRLASPGLGVLNVHSMRFSLPDRPGYVLFILPPADERTAAAFDKEKRRLRASRGVMKTRRKRKPRVA
jgi:transcriptional regulator with XRE-family HTH domain